MRAKRSSSRSAFARTRLAAAVLLAMPAATFAQGDGSALEAIDLDTVTVVGALTDDALDREEIERTQANDLADLFRAIPSVQVGGGVGLAQKIYVRGLEDSLLNVTVDGAPQRGTLFHHIGRVSIEPELLEAVDVQTGPGEATSGFGAIGGAIRFRTRNPVDLLEPGRDAGALLNPLVARVDRTDELVIGDDPVAACGTETVEARVLGADGLRQRGCAHEFSISSMAPVV